MFIRVVSRIKQQTFENAVITGIHEGYTRYTDVRITLAFFAL